MNILVTGGAGFIGSHIVDAYLARGHQVSVLDNLSTGRREFVPAGIPLYQVDLRDAEAVNAVLAAVRPEIVNHHAAQINVVTSLRDPALDAQTNVLGSINLLQACVAYGVRKIIYASTGGAVYGNPDPADLPVGEDYPLYPISPYGISKHTVEHYLFQTAANYGLSYTTLRYSNVYGPRQNPHGESGVVAIFTDCLLRGEPCIIFGDGTQTRDFVYVGDVVAANVAALERGDNGVYNIGTGVETSVLEVVAALEAAAGRPVAVEYAPPRVGEVYRICLDCSRAERELGWRAQVDIREGVRRTWASFAA
ncbi:MAG TPA: NAD-dependent epimerase/dehydratase family protein [Armatimonadetes bacterium]|nr:NAD-dependent epimerase/dehydratase family protein [Armatimonadota bacterium]